ncbi:MAG: VCBS repeat-containing protein [Planctomycetes bacterium]|nr:VCBS repeat-containing protein [Planctomycetota bacterium]
MGRFSSRLARAVLAVTLGPVTLGSGILTGGSRLLAIDCNQNGTEDANDISNRISKDCNQNGVPDECDLQPSFAFEPAKTPTCGTDLLNTIDVAAADFDGDQAMDIASAYRNSNQVCILRRNADGSYEGIGMYEVGSGPWAMVSGDWNGDGKPDVATINRIAQTLSVLINDGNGIFKNAVDFFLEFEPFDLRAGDLDQDGFADIAVIGGFNFLKVLWNDGDGDFSLNTNFTVPSYPNAMTLGQFDGGDQLDIAIGSNSGNPATLAILLNIGNRDFLPLGEFNYSDNPSAMTTADLDGDQDTGTSPWPTTNTTLSPCSGTTATEVSPLAMSTRPA